MKSTVIIKRPEEQFGHRTSISTTLQNLTNTVGGYIEHHLLEQGLMLLCNEEAKLSGEPYNMTINSIQFYGTLVFIGLDDENEWCDVPITFKEFKERYFNGH